MSAALNLAGIHRQHTEEFSFAEIEEQHAELLPARTVVELDIVTNLLGCLGCVRDCGLCGSWP